MVMSENAWRRYAVSNVKAGQTRKKKNSNRIRVIRQYSVCLHKNQNRSEWYHPRDKNRGSPAVENNTHKEIHVGESRANPERLRYCKRMIVSNTIRQATR